eukprot:COSAG01_NODE_9183_length_2528_cov_1.254426_1_plen_30_part_10
MNLIIFQARWVRGLTHGVFYLNRFQAKLDY